MAEKKQPMSLACRLGWHEWVIGPVQSRGYQDKTCILCGKVRRESVY